MIERFFLAFIPIFVAIDPIGLVAIFMGLGTSASREHRRRQAFLGIFTALGIDPYAEYDIPNLATFHRVEDKAPPIREILA